MLPDLPGWGSLPAVTRYHHWAEIIGIAVLALLVIAELASFQYGRRKDDLTDQRHDEEMARLHVEAARLSADAETSRAQIAEAQARTAEAQARVETLRRQLSKRIPDKQAMVPILREAPASVEIAYSKEDMDSITVVSVLKQALTEAGWTITDILPMPAEELAKNGNPLSWWSIEARSIPKEGLILGSQIGFGLPIPPGTAKTPFDILVAALMRGLGAPAIVTGATINPSLEEGHFRLIIMPR